ncbi:MAG TPA: hypothetical protein VE933_08295 [Chitinophagaceae bacterium]|nr:hypothetical protein [Chitinophagaceae bacterium]
MKKTVFNSWFLLTAVLIVTTAAAQDDHTDHKNEKEPKFKKTKSYTKSYSLGSNDKVSLSNQFGEMKISTWDKNEVKVDVSITGKSDIETRAQQILDHISIEDGKSGNTVSFKTKFDDDKKTWNKENKEEHHNEGMEINYMVYLPASIALDADNQFGKMIVPDFRGEAELSCKFGSLDAGKISNAKEVNVEFGEANIDQVNGGKLSIKFSEGTINKLSGDVKTNFEFSQVKLNIGNDVKSLDVNNSYSTVYLDVDKNLSAAYDIRTSHGDFSNKTSFAINEEGGDNDHYGPKFDRKYKGTSGSGGAKLKVNSSFGEIIIGHDLKMEKGKNGKHRSPRQTVS